MTVAEPIEKNASKLMKNLYQLRYPTQTKLAPSAGNQVTVLCTEWHVTGETREK